MKRIAAIADPREVLALRRWLEMCVKLRADKGLKQSAKKNERFDKVP